MIHGYFLTFSSYQPKFHGYFSCFSNICPISKKTLGYFFKYVLYWPKETNSIPCSSKHVPCQLKQINPITIHFHEIHYNYSNHKNQLTKSLDYPNIMTPLFHHCNTEPVHSIAHSTFRWYPVKGLRGFPSEPPCPHQTLLFHRRTYRKRVCG